MAHDSSQHASKRLQDRLKTASRGQGASQGGPREAKILQKPKEEQCCWASPLFASDGLLRPQDGSKMAQEGPKRGPRGPPNCPKRCQERSRRAPRGDFRCSGGARLIRDPPCFDRIPPRCLKESLRGFKISHKRAPRSPQDAPKRPPRRSKRAPNRRTIGPRRLDGLQTAQKASKTPHEASKSTPKRTPKAKSIDFPLVFERFWCCLLFCFTTLQ